MLRRALAATRYIVLVAVLGTFIAALALLCYELIVVADAVLDIVRGGSISPTVAKTLAVVIAALTFFLTITRKRGPKE